MPDHDATEFDDLHPHLRSPPGTPEYQRAWSRFWTVYEPRIRGWARGLGLTAAWADEAVGRVMAQLVKVMPTFQYDPEKRFSPWLRTVTRNIVADLWASAAKRPGAVGHGGSSALEQVDQLPDEEAASNALDAVLGPALDEFLERVRRDAEVAVRARVDAATWRAFELIERLGRTGKQAADETGKTVAGVFVARKRVKDRIEEEVLRIGVSRRDEIGG